MPNSGANAQLEEFLLRNIFLIMFVFELPPRIAHLALEIEERFHPCFHKFGDQNRKFGKLLDTLDASNLITRQLVLDCWQSARSESRAFP